MSVGALFYHRSIFKDPLQFRYLVSGFWSLVNPTPNIERLAQLCYLVSGLYFNSSPIPTLQQKCRFTFPNSRIDLITEQKTYISEYPYG